MILRFKALALWDLQNLYDYILPENPVAAQAVVGAIEQSIGFLEANPRMGHEGSVVGTRELVIPAYPYIVVYEFLEEDGAIDILRIYHAAQDRP